MPFSYLFRFIIFIRHFLYRVGIKKTYHFSVPVIVVGNITVGGTGKTPFVIWLAQFLKAQGFKPGIVSRGVGGRAQKKPRVVKVQDAPSEVGDEAILLARKSGCPVVIGIDRVAAAHELLHRAQCDVIVSDDGLQHYRLHRDVEIALVDAKRKLGNQHLLPAGPLREGASRLRKVDLVIVNGGHDAAMSYHPLDLISLKNPQKKVTLKEFTYQKVHAVAGIGHPESFFQVLRDQGFDVVTHVFPDHHLYRLHDLDFSDSLPILMTEKDAVKCESFADERYWYLTIDVKIDDTIKEKLLTKLKLLRGHYAAEEDFGQRACRTTSVQCSD